MSRMLALIGAGWASVRSSATHSRHRADALARVTRLLARPDLPAPVAAEAHQLAGELLIAAERYTEARRHLRSATTLAPTCARAYYLRGLASERDPHGCDRRAALSFRQAANLEPGNALYRAAFGRAAVRCDRVRLGVRALLAAADAAPGELPVVRIVVEGLTEAGRTTAARKILTKARFLCVGQPAAHELAALGERVRFEAARCEQRGTTRHRQDAEHATDGGRVVLPFLRVTNDTLETEKQTGTETRTQPVVRRDVVSFPRPHFPRPRAGHADR